MKDEHDKQTLDCLGEPAKAIDAVAQLHAGFAPQGHGCMPAQGRKVKRLPHQSMHSPPEGAKPELTGLPLGFGRSVVPVSSVARDWGISTRRVRLMLAEGRLSGRQLENGYWEVYYPYSYIFGTRGPAIKRQRKQEGKPE